MKNVYFIEAKSPGAHIFSRKVLPRLGCVLLATILKAKGYNTKVFIEDIEVPSIGQLKDADVVCISSITSTAKRAFELGKNLKLMGKIVVMGGSHSTFLPEESLQYADYVVRGEGEETIVELMDHLQGRFAIEDIKGLSYNDPAGTVVKNPDREFVADLNDAPIPDFNLVYKWEKAQVMPIATSRGCPFNCKFCSVIPMFGRRMRFKSLDRVIEEIRYAKRISPKSHVFFIDDNFAPIKERERTKKLLRRMIKEGIELNWSAQVRADAARDQELVGLMEKAGCFNVYIGFESVNPKTLKAYNKAQSLDDVENSIRVFQKYSIRIHGMFVLGADTDDISTIKNTGKFAKKLGLNSIQFMILTPFPGTGVFGDLKSTGRIISWDWSKYDAHHAVFEPEQMTAFELHIETLKAMARFYSWRAAIVRLWNFDFFYFIVMLYGKRSTRRALRERKLYFRDIKQRMAESLKIDEIRKRFADKRKAVIGVVVNDPENLGIKETKFFKIFLGKLLNSNSDISVEGCGDTSKLETIFGQEKNKVDVQSIETFSLFKMCEKIGWILDKRRKVRKAYDEALKNIGGKPFACSKIQLVWSK